MAAPVFITLLALIAIPVGIIAVIYLIVPAFKAIGWLFRQIFRFIFGEIGDVLRMVGALITQIFFLPLIVGNVLIGRWSASAHYGRALGAEFKTFWACIYRCAIGHPARLLCLNALVDGIEKRVPQAIAAAPGADKPSKSRTGQFDGYQIVGSLPGGGSGGKLYIANPDAIRLAGFTRAGQPDVRQVVIKTFSLKDGSSLPQIVRESRALEAAKRLGLVLDHELSDERFYYVMKYMPGESLGLVTQRLHAMAGGSGLDTGQLRQSLSYGSDLLRTLDQYHRGGLWHKDVKPDNIIVDGRSAHLVDFGLVTPLRSGMTLTTHGTEYFRDPEMVRMALKGVKVHQVDGCKFDVYAAGAVLFSMIENSFPAHGGLSQITKRCPEALRWVVRRAMTEYDKRYTSAAAMLADLEVVRAAPDPFAVRPADLPSMRGVAVDVPAYEDDAPIRPEPIAVGVGAGSDGPTVPPPLPRQAEARIGGAGSPIPPRARPNLKVNRWWTGGYQTQDANQGAARVEPAVFRPDDLNKPEPNQRVYGVRFGKDGFAGAVVRVGRAPASDQLASAQSRAKAARGRAQARMAGRRQGGGKGSDFHVFNGGVVGAVALFMIAIFGAAAFMFAVRGKNVRIVRSTGPDGQVFVSVDLPGMPGTNGRFVPMPPEVPSPNDNDGHITFSDPSRPGPRIVVNSSTVGASSTLGAEHLPFNVKGHRVLVVSDIQPMSPSVTSTLDRLESAGFSLIGNLPGSQLDEETRAEQEELEASVKMVRGLGQLDAPDISSHISHWIADQQDLNLLVWFVRSEDQTRERCYIFGPALDSEFSGQELAERDSDIAMAQMMVAPPRK